MKIDPQAAIEHAKRCQALAQCINQTFIDWLTGTAALSDPQNFVGVRRLLDDPNAFHIWSEVYRAMRREVSAIEPLLNQFGGWFDGVPFERWIADDGPALRIYLACSNAIIEDENSGQYDAAAVDARANAACREMFHGGEPSDYGRFARTAGVDIARQCDGFCLAIDGVVREMQRRESEPQLTPDEARSKFCFDEWEAGKTYKEINAALKRYPQWEHFGDEKSVRGPINAWGKRIGVNPRQGQRGRRESAK